MRKLVFWTGVYNLFLAGGFFVPGVLDLLGIPAPESPFWVLLPATLVLYLGVLLIFCSRDLAHRGPLVVWEGVLRCAAFALLTGYGIWGGLGAAAVAIGVVDLAIGLAYFTVVPKGLETTLGALLRDQVSGG